MIQQPAPPLPPVLRDHAWQAFRIDTPEEIAAATFQQRYGRPPEYILESLNNLLAGPVPTLPSPVTTGEGLGVGADRPGVEAL